MSIKYDLPSPDIRYRNRKYPEDLHAGDVVAYSKILFRNHYYTGVMVIGDYNMFLVATNWDCNEELWYNDIIDDSIELFAANEEETSWGTRFLFDYLYCRDDQKSGLEAILKFVDATFPKENGIGWREKEQCMNFMIELPWCVSNVDWNEAKTQLWKIAYKEIQDTGLQFNKARVELFCFLIGVLMIADSTSDNYKLKELLRTFKNKWIHFIWMYALTLGRLMGTELKNFTGVVHQLDNPVRVPYLHLYLPLIEGNVDKICMYNPSEKRYKLENAIRKMQKVEALEHKKTDLDEIYQILFPKHFRQAMADNRPAATIADLKEKLAERDQIITKLQVDIDNVSKQYNAVLEQLKSAVNDVENDRISAEDLTESFLMFPTDLALSYFGTMSTLLALNPTWQKYAPQIHKQILTKQKEQQDRQEQKQNKMIETVREAANKPTTQNIYGDKNDFQDGAQLLKMAIPESADPAEIATRISEQQRALLEQKE